MAAASVAMRVAAAPPAAQQVPPAPTKGDLAKDNKLFITLARKALKWDEPTAPARIVGPLHYVGTAGLASYLFATKDGHILFNTGMPESGPTIVESIRKLGFDAKDIKVLINGHGHSDHAGAFAFFKQLTGAQIAIMEPDVAMIEDGGKSDFHYGHDWQIMGQPPVKVDRVLRDGDSVRLGEVVLVGPPYAGPHVWGDDLGNDPRRQWSSVQSRLARWWRVQPGLPDCQRADVLPRHQCRLPADAPCSRDAAAGHLPRRPREWFNYEQKRDRARRDGVHAG